ncbi:MAG: hypothetical protein Q7S21_06340 [archaeon]|nr:hypothetical protein [archaeon]
MPAKKPSSHPRKGRFGQRFYVKPKPRRIIGKQKPVRSKENPIKISIACGAGVENSPALARGLKKILRERGLSELFQVSSFGLIKINAIDHIREADIIITSDYMTGLLYPQWMKSQKTKKYKRAYFWDIPTNVKRKRSTMFKMRNTLAKKLVLTKTWESRFDNVLDNILRKVKKEFRLIKE